jgi:hypothetical protein
MARRELMDDFDLRGELMQFARWLAAEGLVDPAEGVDHPETINEFMQYRDKAEM